MSVALLGLPFDEGSSFLPGCAAAPEAIRAAFASPSSNTCAENEHDVAADSRFCDAGDVPFAEGDELRKCIETHVARLLQDDCRVLSLGGDHAVTWPVLAAYGKQYPELTVVQLDAHPDLYDELDGDRWSHACPFARAFEAGAIARLVQLGIRTMNAAQRTNADRFAVEVISARDFENGHRLSDLPPLSGPVYLSLDLDVLDPAFAPGVSHHEPGGFSVRDVLAIIQSLNCELVGADIVELNPSRDAHDQTAMVAAKFLKEIAVKLLE